MDAVNEANMESTHEPQVTSHGCVMSWITNTLMIYKKSTRLD